MFFFLKNSFQLDVFWPRRGLQTNHGTVQKVQFPCNGAIENSLNEAILLQDETLRLPSNQDLMYEGDSNF